MRRKARRRKVGLPLLGPDTAPRDVPLRDPEGLPPPTALVASLPRLREPRQVAIAAAVEGEGREARASYDEHVSALLSVEASPRQTGDL